MSAEQLVRGLVPDDVSQAEWIQDWIIHVYEAPTEEDEYYSSLHSFIECIKTRKRPASDIEIGHHSTTTAILGNMAFRSKLHLDWDAQRETTLQPEARHLLKREYRKPWKLEV